MENVIDLGEAITDFENIKRSDFKDSFKIKVYSDTHDLFVSNSRNEQIDSSIFGIWIEIGENKTIMLNAPMNELELFAHSVLKHIEIVRKTYSEQIDIQNNMGSVI